MYPNSTKQQLNPIQNEYSYDNEQFESPADDSYASKVDRLFTVNYESSSYQNIELSTTQMRLMMKEVSKKLDQKIHKYYGLMGQKHVKEDDDLQLVKEKLKKQLETSQKLVETQITQINDIQLIDEQMASSKRMEKQAERLRHYFETKKAMIEADKQARFSKGEMNKAGDYLARDLDSQKHYFRLNKIKQDLQYAMLKERNLTKNTEELEQKYRELQTKHDKINQVYEQKLSQAQTQKLLISDNKNFFTQFQTKKQLIQLKQQIKKKTEILKYNIQNTVMKIASDVQKMKKTQKQHTDKIISCEDRILIIEKQINQNKQNAQLTKRYDFNMSLKNIDVLLKTKKQKNDSMLKNSSQLSQSNELQLKPTVEMTQSSVLLKPNFKIKHFLTRSKSKIDSKDLRNNKSMDFGRKLSQNNALNDLLQSAQNKVSTYDKRVLKWQPRKKTDTSRKLLPLSAPKDIRIANPQHQINQIHEE